MIVDLDELNLRQFLEACHQWARNIVERAIRLASSGQVDIHPAIRNFNLAVASEAVCDEGQPLVSFYAGGSLEKLIQHGTDKIL